MPGLLPSWKYPKRKAYSMAPRTAKAPVIEEAGLAYDPSTPAANFPEQEYKPTDRIPAGEVIYVRNNTPSIVRFKDHFKDEQCRFNLIFKPAGAENFDSIRSLEGDELRVLRNPGFQRWWAEGRLTVTNNPDIQPRSVDDSYRETERTQQLEKNFTFNHTAPGSAPLLKSLDWNFLETYNPDSPKFEKNFKV